MSKKPTDSVVYWIRSDLRLSDNIALWEAAKSNKDLIAIYIKNFNKSLKKGASISVDGVCLTSVDKGIKKLRFDVIEETISRTNIKAIKKGSVVNLERSIKASTEIGGHLMSGHIHCTGKIKKILNKNSTKDIIVEFPKKFKEYIFEKGYIGFDPTADSMHIGSLGQIIILMHFQKGLFHPFFSRIFLINLSALLEYLV